jgi:hypothetical protein
MGRIKNGRNQRLCWRKSLRYQRRRTLSQNKS